MIILHRTTINISGIVFLVIFLFRLNTGVNYRWTRSHGCNKSELPSSIHYETVPMRSLLLCIGQCLTNSNCQSIVFDGNDMICYLMNVSAEQVPCSQSTEISDVLYLYEPVSFL